jgi:glutamine amidotransferase
MERLRSRGLDAVVREVAAGEQPLLGICLGMQLFFDRSQEGNVACLGLIPGTVRLLRGEVKIPHIGWNQVAVQSEAPLWRGLQAAPKSGPRRADKSGPYFYFVHSYICEPLEPADVAGTTEHGEQFCSAVVRDRIWGTQFHPERSGQTGMQLIRNFVEWCSAKPQDSGHGFV